MWNSSVDGLSQGRFTPGEIVDDGCFLSLTQAAAVFGYALRLAG
jgi:hypothetical protein